MPRGVRLNPEHDERTRAYVYCIARDGQIIYVGKGTGRRFETQKRRLNGDGGSLIIERCKNETHAFRRERELIAKLGPVLNRCPGGNGGRRKRRASRRYAWESWDTKVYAAKVLMAVYRVAPERINPAVVPKLFQILQGARE